MAPNIVRVYLPVQCLKEASGLMIGFVDNTHMSCCITGLHCSVNGCSLPLQKLDNNSCGVIGLWQNQCLAKNVECSIDGITSSCEFFLRICQNTDKILSFETDKNADVTVILFDAVQFVYSVFADLNAETSPTNVGIIAQAFSRHRLYAEDNHSQKASETQTSIKDFTRLSSSFLSVVQEFILKKFIWFAMFFTGIFSFLFSIVRFVMSCWLTIWIYSYQDYLLVRKFVAT
jgi:hypothetical protein